MKVTLCCMLLASTVTVSASSQKATDNNLAKYLERVQLAETSVPTHTLGSAWSDNGRMASLTSDYKARSAGDLITILVVHDLSSSSTGAVSTDRSFKATSGVDSLPGRLKTTGVANLF